MSRNTADSRAAVTESRSHLDATNGPIPSEWEGAVFIPILRAGTPETARWTWTELVIGDWPCPRFLIG